MTDEFDVTPEDARPVDVSAEEVKPPVVIDLTCEAEDMGYELYRHPYTLARGAS